MSEKLKPCPFCGGEAAFDRLGDRRQSCQVSCTNCGTHHESSDTGDFNGSSWNEREAMKWIPIAREKPPSGKKVVILIDDSDLWYEAYWDEPKNLFIDGRGGYFRNASHWMIIEARA